VVKEASVEGVIPIAEVLAHFAVPSTQFPIMNLLEVHPDYIRISGLVFEEYLISAHSQEGSLPQKQ
jgi:hypothetical protein